VADPKLLETGRLSRLAAACDEEWLFVFRKLEKEESWVKKKAERQAAKGPEAFIRNTTKLDRFSVALRLESTNLDLQATSRDIEKLCFEALEENIGAVCVSPHWAAFASALVGKKARVVATLDFPHGQDKTAVKIKQALESCQDGAAELDMVANHSLLAEKKLGDFFADVAEVKNSLWEGVGLKVILEFALLEPELKILGALGAFYAGADWIKTSTGVMAKTAREDVELLFRLFGPSFPIKAAGGIRKRKDVETLYEAGAERFGTSTAAAILKEF
jgi:deoxyribose-phosphate aldolase